MAAKRGSLYLMFVAPLPLRSFWIRYWKSSAQLVNMFSFSAYDHDAAHPAVNLDCPPAMIGRMARQKLRFKNT